MIDNTVPKDWFKAYVTVQVEGKFNMLYEAEQARESAGLTREQYTYVVQNYRALNEMFPEVKENIERRELEKLKLGNSLNN